MNDLNKWLQTRRARGLTIYFALADETFRVLKTNIIDYWGIAATPDPEGLWLTDIFPELVGVEDQLVQLLDSPDKTLRIPKILRDLPNGCEQFYDLNIEPVSQFGGRLLATIVDVTNQSLLEQQLIQQRNELRLNILARVKVEEALGEAKSELENRVAERTVELRQANERLRALSNRLVEVQEMERRELARELHDEVGQSLTGLKLLLGMCSRLPPAGALNNVEEALGLVQDLMNTVRELSLDLRPAMLDDLGLTPALLWLFQRYTTQTGVQVDFKHGDIERRFDTDIETAAFRIVQEALTNVARHAGVSEVFVRLWVDQKKLHIQIEDQGEGFEPQAAISARTSSGLSGMHERAMLLNGDLDIESTPGKGTQITAELPIPEQHGG